MAKYVLSTTLGEPLPWINSTLIKSSVAEEVSKLKQPPGRDILIYGSGRLCNTLLAHGLIDEYRLWLVPVIWGSGKRIFDGLDRMTLELVETETLATGTVIVSYGPAQSQKEG